VGIYSTRRKKEKKMKEGFDNVAKVTVYKDEVEKILKNYKKIKKYMKSPLFAIKTMDGNENIVNSLLSNNAEDG
jgi:hypothetical protein